PVEIRPGMVFALETQHGKRFRWGVRIEEMLIVHDDRIEIISNFPVKQITGGRSDTGIWRSRVLNALRLDDRSCRAPVRAAARAWVPKGGGRGRRSPRRGAKTQRPISSSPRAARQAADPTSPAPKPPPFRRSH